MTGRELLEELSKMKPEDLDSPVVVYYENGDIVEADIHIKPYGLLLR